jgi:hypothetical protein
MYTRLDALTLSFLAALGLEFGCTLGPGPIGETESETGKPGDGDGDPSTGDGDSSSGDGDTGTMPYVCDGAEPIMQAGTDIPSGFVRCEDGFVHRVEAVVCVDPQGPDTRHCAEFPGQCATAADCTDGPHGSCRDYGWESWCSCHYGCTSDADCDEGYACACAGVMSDAATCVPAGCLTDAGCGEGLCGLSKYEGCCGSSYKLACAGPNAECHVNADCGEGLCDPGWPDGGMVQYQCSAAFDDSWSCQPPGWCGCDCGRPFFVDGQARVAAVVARTDWSAALEPQPVDLITRRALAAYWAEVGGFEHASVASFARFALQLMQLGAPPQLLADTRAALVDEIEHARLAFGLASAYAGAPLGPGALVVDGCLATPDTRAIIEGLIFEACVGETLAAIEAQEAASRACDPVVAGILEQIADDELRHARLGWRSLRWILDGAGDELRRFALTTLEAAVRVVASETPTTGRPLALREHGVLDDALRVEVREAALAAVVRPCVAALVQRFGESTISNHPA